MTEDCIVHENGGYWVCDDRDRYTVLVPYGIVASVTDSAYPHDDDGLSIAIARCNYLAKKALDAESGKH